MKQSKIYIYGRHALWEALMHAPHALLKVFFDVRATDAQLRAAIKQSGLPTAALNEGYKKADLRAGAAHQNIIGQVSLHKLLVPYEDFVRGLKAGPHTSLVLLNGVQDPHNVGALIRSAAAFGASGILLPERGQAPITGTVLTVSAGMAFRLPLVSVGDFGAAVRDLKQKGFKVYALAGEGAEDIGKVTFNEPSLFILGNEAKGIAPATRALCDKVLSIPMSPRAESLNVAASGAVALYAWSAQHPEALKIY